MKPLTNSNALITKSSGNVLHVLFEIMVLIHHLYATSTYVGGEISALLGPIAVGGFIFLSGYGVAASYLNDGDKYVEKLAFVRIPRTYLIILIADIFYLGLYLFTGGTFNNFFSGVISVLYLPIFSGFVPLSHWIYFLADLLVYYALFIICVKIFKNTKHTLTYSAITLFALSLLAIAVLSIINAKTGSTRFLRACVCFPVGILFAQFNNKIRDFLKEYKYLIFAATFMIGTLFAVFVNTRATSEYLISIIFVLCVIILFFGVEVKGKVMPYLSSLVLYVYVSHEFFLTLMRYFFADMNANLMGLIVASISFAFAVALKFLLGLKKLKK